MVVSLSMHKMYTFKSVNKMSIILYLMSKYINELLNVMNEFTIYEYIKKSHIHIHTNIYIAMG